MAAPAKFLFDVDFAAPDKGREKAFVETLVYRGGTIIAAKRTSYADQLAGGQLSDDILGR